MPARRPSAGAAATASRAAGIATATAPFSAAPQATATIPSSPTRARISASPARLPTT